MNTSDHNLKLWGMLSYCYMIVLKIRPLDTLFLGPNFPRKFFGSFEVKGRI